MTKLSAGELMQWYYERPRWPRPSEQMLREMEAEGYSFEIRDGAPYIHDKGTAVGP